MKELDIARALRDQAYFNSLSPGDQAKVREAGGIGESEVSDSDLDSVSGGLEGGEALLATTTSGSGCDPDTSEEGIGPRDPVVCVC